MKKVLLIALCFAIPMVGFAQKKKKKGAEPEVVAPVVEEMSDDEETVGRSGCSSALRRRFLRL